MALALNNLQRLICHETKNPNQTYFATINFLKKFPQKVLFLMKQVKYHNGFIYFTKYKSSLVTLILV